MTVSNHLAPIIAKLTYNGAANLVGTIEHPDPGYPDNINGNHRISTGLGKWTILAAIGVERHLIKLGVAEIRTEVRGWQKSERLAITPLGREVAVYLKANWDQIAHTLLDKTRSATGR